MPATPRLHLIALGAFGGEDSRERWDAVKQKNDRAVGRPGFAIKDIETIYLDGFVKDALLADPGKCVHKQCHANDFANQFHAANTASGYSFARDWAVDPDLSKSLMRTMR
jgi:hypothetical protein